MTPREILKIRDALSELNNVVFPYKIARKIAGLNRHVQNEVDVISAQENALINKFHGKRKGNSLDFGDVDVLEQFLSERNEMMEEDNEEIRFTPVDLHQYTNLLNLTPKAIDALDGVIIFEAGDDDDDS